MPLHTGRCPECGRKHRKDLNGVEARAVLLSEGKKHCNRCGEVKDLTAFSRHAAQKDGVQTYCKMCQSAATKASNAKQPDHAQRRLEAQRRYRSGQTQKQRAAVPYTPPAAPIGHCLAVRRSHLERKYGISLAEYRALFDAQGGVCAICGEVDTNKPEYEGKRWSLSVDHDHGTREVRALLCGKCNWGLGSFRDSPELMEAAAAYVRRYRK